ncbi:MAG TPA: DUF1554 domain-containing protein [Steroidobacteraceae bacterium]|nr:DUF1554 domain-containing protein [Steroidobacteraceae bacterium]
MVGRAVAALVVASFASVLVSCGGGSDENSGPVSAGLKIFATDRVHNGNFATDSLLTGNTAMDRADNFCETDSAKPDSGVYKALLVDGVDRDALLPADWVMKPNTPYYQSHNNVRIAVTDANGLFGPNLEHDIHDSFGTGGTTNTPPPTSTVWTGFEDGTTFTAYPMVCDAWSTSDRLVDAPFGISYGTDGTELRGPGGQVCSGESRIYCVEQ